MLPRGKRTSLAYPGITVFALHILLFSVHAALEGPAFEQHSSWVTKAAGDDPSSVVQHQVKPCEVFVACKWKLGNQLLSLVYAVHTARVLGVKLRAPNGRCYAGLFGPSSDALHFDFTQKDSTDKCDGTWGPVDFWIQESGFNPTTHEWFESAELVKARFNYTRQAQSGARTALYMRSGDIFADPVHPLYVQAPCAFYIKVLQDLLPRESDGSQVTLVNDYGAPEEEQNPCVKVLTKRYPNIIKEKRSILEDWLELATAPNVVLPGGSTYVLTAVLLSSETRNVFMPSWSPQDLRQQMQTGTLSRSQLRHPEASTGSPWFFLLPHMPSYQTHRYLVHNYTMAWSKDMFYKVVKHPRRLITKMTASSVRSVSPPIATQSVTVILGCIGQSPVELAGILNNMWYKRFNGGWWKKFVPVIAFVPKGWQEQVLQHLETPGKYHMVLFEDTAVHDNAASAPSNGNTLPSRFVKSEKGYCLAPEARSLLYAIGANPFSTTHFLWSFQDPDRTVAKYEGMVEEKLHACKLVTHSPDGEVQQPGKYDFAASGGYLVAPGQCHAFTSSLTTFTYLPKQEMLLRTFCKSSLLDAGCHRPIQ